MISSLAVVRQSRSKSLLGAALVACLIAVPLWVYDCAMAPLTLVMGRQPATATELGFVTAEIYFVPWDVMPTVGISLETLRSPSLRREVVHDWRRLDDLLLRLHPERLQAGASPRSPLGDYRLLIVFSRADGSEVSYAADFNELVNPATRQSRPIDADFRAAFSPGAW